MIASLLGEVCALGELSLAGDVMAVQGEQNLMGRIGVSPACKIGLWCMRCMQLEF